MIECVRSSVHVRKHTQHYVNIHSMLRNHRRLTNGLIEARTAMKRIQTNMTCICARTMQPSMFELVTCSPTCILANMILAACLFLYRMIQSSGLIEAHAAMKRIQTHMTCICTRTMRTSIFAWARLHI